MPTMKTVPLTMIMTGPSTHRSDCLMTAANPREGKMLMRLPEHGRGLPLTPVRATGGMQAGQVRAISVEAWHNNRKGRHPGRNCNSLSGHPITCMCMGMSTASAPAVPQARNSTYLRRSSISLPWAL